MIIRTAKDLPVLIEWLSKQTEVAFDLETGGLNPRKNVITDFAFSNGERSFCIIANEWSSEHNAFTPNFSMVSLKPLMNMLAKKKLITWNGGFDTRFIYHKFDIELWRSIHADGMLAAHTLDENRYNYGLKVIAAEEFGESAVSAQQDMLESIKANGGSPKEYYKANAELRATYAMQDVKLTWDLWRGFESDLKRQDLLTFFQGEVMELYRTVTVKMECFGVPVDVPLLERSQKEITEALTALEDKIQAAIAPLLGDFHAWYLERKFPFKLSGEFLNKLAEMTAPHQWPRTKAGGFSFSDAELTKAVKKQGLSLDCDLYRIHKGEMRVPAALKQQVQLALLSDSGVKYPFNILSKDHLKRLFFTKLGESALSHTDLGNPQVDDEFLTLMAEKYPWCNDLQTYNRLTKIKGTYIDRFLDGQEDGIFYPSFFQHRTVSGRYSGDLQQLPRPLEPGQEADVIVEFNNRIRRFFISSPSWTFADFDYDSQEVKVFAHVSGEDKIKDIFARGDDFYSAVYLEAEGAEGMSANKSAPNYLGKLNKPARQKAKSYALGLAFGMTPYKLKFELNCSELEAQKIFNQYFTAYPNLKSWKERSIRFALENGWVHTEAGRMRRYPGLKEAYRKHGEVLLDGLELWKAFHETPRTYAEMKELASRCKNYLNNALNHQIQGLAASITNRAAIKTARELAASRLQAYVANVLHDQITVHCPDEELPLVMEILQRCMETAYPISVPLTAPPSHGKNWAESK